MTINLDELRKTVENAGEAWADGEHIDIITPAVVRELIEEIESLRTRFKGMRASRDSERSRADKKAHNLEQAEQAVARVRAMADEMGEGKAFGILTRGREDEYPISYFIEMLEDALDGETHE